MSNLVGQQIAHYQIKALLGQGRFGTVYQAVDLEDQQPVALKVVSMELAQRPEFRSRFLQEVQAIPRLEHPSIVKVHEAGVDTDQDLLYLTMDYVTERSLLAHLQQLAYRGEMMRSGEALLIGAQIADALAYAHQRGVLHRDIRPNIILFKRDDHSIKIGNHARRAMIGDFALASVLAAESAPFAGSLPYMSPEQCLRQTLDGRSDVYSLGAVLYQLVAGREPFEIKSVQDALQKHQFEAPPSLTSLRPEVSAVVEGAIFKALSKSPGERYQTAAEMAEALRKAAASLPDSMAAATLDSAVGSVDTQYEALEQFAAQDSLWVSDEDRLTITEDMPRFLNREIVTIGRSENNDISLASPSVTRRHAQLERSGETWSIRDLGSQNGTFLDGHRLLPDIPEEWFPHQSLRIGPFYLQLQKGRGFDFRPHPFEVAISPNELEVAPGKKQVLQVSVMNNGAATDSFVLRMERLPASWATLPDEALQVRAGQQATTTITIHPPFSHDVQIGSHRYLLCATSQANPDDTVSVPGMVHVKRADTDFSLDLFPAEIEGKGTSQLFIRNEALSEATYSIVGYSPDEAIRFSEYRPLASANGRARTTSSQRKPSGSGAGMGKSPLGRLLLRRPQAAFSRLLRIPANALNRILPGLGSALGVDKAGRQLGQKLTTRDKASGRPASPVPVASDPTKWEKVSFPGQLRTEADVASGQQQEIRLAVAPRRRPWLGRETQSLPFQIQVNSSSGQRHSVDGLLNVRPRLKTQWSAAIIVALFVFICLASSALYVYAFNPTLKQMLAAPGDIDGDGLSNLAEVYLHKTNPNKADTDSDGLSDGEEIELGLVPTDPDIDRDGLLDSEERALSTNPLTADSDGDELSDSLEVRVLNTDPLTADTLPIDRSATPTPEVVIPTPEPQPTTPPLPTPTALQDTFSSIAADDGFIGMEGFASGLAVSEGETLQIGDDLSPNRQYKGIVSFDTSTLPDNALIQSVMVRLRRSGSSGLPYNLGQIHVDIAPRTGFGGSTSLENGDFNASAALVNVTTLSEAGSNGAWAEGLFSDNSINAINRQGITQLRLYFTLPNDSNGDRDWLTFNSGDHPNDAFHPQLIVNYELP